MVATRFKNEWGPIHKNAVPLWASPLGPAWSTTLAGFLPDQA